MRALICIESLRPGSFVGGGGSGEGGVGGRGSGLITRQARNRRTSAQRFSRAVHPIFWFSFLSFFNLGNFNVISKMKLVMIFLVIRMFQSSFFHPYPPSAGIRSSFYRHPDRHGAVSLRYRNRTEITVLMCER